jgi:hypothetical protein
MLNRSDSEVLNVSEREETSVLLIPLSRPEVGQSM